MKISISEQINIISNKSDIWKQISDLNQWSNWSPWVSLDPKCETRVTKEGGYQTYRWEGPISGTGEIKVSKVSENHIEFHLSFIKPFKSNAKVSFDIYPNNDFFVLRWNMEYQLPFFLFFLKKFLMKGLSKDFLRGLKRIKYTIEQGKIPAKFDFVDIPMEIEGFNFAGSNVENVHLKELPQVMSKEFSKVFKVFESENISPDYGYCFCNKFNFLKDTFNLSIGNGYKGSAPKNLITKTIGNHKAIKVTLTGSYDFMEDAWTGIVMHTRALKIKPLKKIPPYEKYIKGPHNTDHEENYVTEIFFPTK